MTLKHIKPWIQIRDTVKEQNLDPDPLLYTL